MHGGKEGEASFCITRGNATLFFEVKKGVLDQVPYTVQFSVVIALFPAIFSGRDDGLAAGLNNLVYKLIAVISTVSQKRLRTQTVNQCARFLAISSGTFCNNNSERHTMRIHGQMYFGVEPPFVRLIAWLPPTAPAAWGCTLQWLASIISHS